MTTTTAREKTTETAIRLYRYLDRPEYSPAGSEWSDLWDCAQTLRRASLTLSRWAEEECNGTIQRDDEGVPYRYGTDRYGSPALKSSRPIPDREAGAIRRASEAAARLGLSIYHQTDPRGCALYVGSVADLEADYTRGVAVC